MDEELKAMLDRRFDAVAELIHQHAQHVDARLDALITRFDTQAARLDRHAGLLQTGNRWVSRLNDWSDKVDQALDQKDREIESLRERVREIDDLKRRVEKLEQGGQAA